MKTFLALIVSIFMLGTAPAALSQESAWIQIEAHRTLAEGEARARSYAASFPNVAGFRVSGGWYAIALGPYTQAAAEAELGALKNRRLIPRDSYLTLSGQYGQQFWPVGANTLFSQPQDGRTALSTPLAPTELAQRA